MTMGDHPLRRLARHLFALTRCLAISPATVCDREDRDELSLTAAVQLPLGSAHDIPPETRTGEGGQHQSQTETETNELAGKLHRLLVDLVRLGGPDLELDFTIPNSPFPLLSPTADLTVEEVAELIATGGAVELSLSLDKAALAKRHLGHEAAVFLCRQRLIEELSRPLSDWQEAFAKRPPGQKLVLLAALDDIDLEGDYLAVVGGQYLDGWTADSAGRISAPPPPATPASSAATEGRGQPAGSTRQDDGVRPADMADDAVAKVNWIGLHFAVLTPLHLAVKPSAEDYDPEGCPIASALYSRWLDLCLAYAANRTRRNRKVVDETPDDWIATFGSEDSLARVRFGSAATVARTSAEDGAEPQGVVLPQRFRKGVEKIHEMVVWAYGGHRQDSDRLHALQNIVAQNLRGQSEENAYAAIVGSAAEIERHKDWFWETYLKGKLNQYFDRIARVMQFVDDVRERYEEQLQQLTKNLVDSALAGVGVVVGTFIAAMFKGQFNAVVFEAGVLLYAAYLFFFPAVLGLTNVWTRFREERKAFSQRQVLFRAHLYEKSVAGLLNPATAAETRFKIWFLVAVLIYLKVCSLLVYGAFHGPAHLGLV